MVQSTSPFRAISVEDSCSDLDNLPAALKELDDAGGVAHRVESKLDTLIAHIEALERSLESQLETSSQESNANASGGSGEGQRGVDQAEEGRV